MDIRILTVGDAAFTIEFPGLEGVSGARQVAALRSRVQEKIKAGQLSGIVDIISASRALTICIDPFVGDFKHLQTAVAALAKQKLSLTKGASQLWRLPACYEGDYGPDLEDVAARSGMTAREVITLHSDREYELLQIGFLPGFPFLAEIDERLRFPRRTSPRVRVPAGSVGIANAQTAIYPWESPGGWHLLARCPVPLFNPLWARPSLLDTGAKVKFEPVSSHDLLLLQQDLASGKLDPHSFVAEGGEG
ncbi:5-oxoprolinase subunit PxpB [Kiloniella laminariae]|uniref:5-oxoprolinase subunit PxpB n=1 Tax=Kiloniella laminariae TaxID=454162 RepID=A0ABT4LMW2_9PROT|nr:5-oxoprolinase subunit PxpB [Kiloniella laminariae]MCZ4282473.1 5-oxoprolinase subunit PxpB [Kiloniella laminariae]